MKEAEEVKEVEKKLRKCDSEIAADKFRRELNWCKVAKNSSLYQRRQI